MKKLLMIMICMTVLMGCANGTDNDKGTNNSNNNNTGDTTNNNATWYDRFETGLKDKNLTYSTKTSLDATTIGGAEGYRYATDNGNIDVYRFEDGDDFDRIVKEKKIDFDDGTKKVEVNDHMIIVSDGVSEDVMGIFRGLK